MLVRSSKMRFVNGSRVRPGEPFELPDGVALKPDMEVISRASQPAPVKGNRSGRKEKGFQNTFSAMAREDAADQLPGTLPDELA
jgi:hypothetical protein